ncbi:hypothetical protein ACH5RR_000778 [Cinchona calisaya]|uniref:Uncharacterized protein n=1 Tax=Cinchona calisaya TaxID=153742 RepID=A0ABD3B1I8_9GENT
MELNCLGQFEAANVAKKCLLAAVKADTRAAHLWSNLANAYFSMGDHRNASKFLEKSNGQFGILPCSLDSDNVYKLDSHLDSVQKTISGLDEVKVVENVI